MFILLSFAFTCSVSGQVSDADKRLLKSLKSEASYDQKRREHFNEDRLAKKIFSHEREKGLASFLEDQEKWDLIREKGLAEYRKQKQTRSPVEGGPEYLEDQKRKNIENKKMERARELTVSIRDQILSKENPNSRTEEEMEELGLLQNRPRFDLRKRGKNHWIKKGTMGENLNKSTSDSSGFSPPPPAFDDYPIQPDYIPAPIEGFEEIPPPPPPPINFDGGGMNGFPYNGNIDSGFGEPPPPPPPPPPFDDFN